MGAPRGVARERPRRPNRVRRSSSCATSPWPRRPASRPPDRLLRQTDRRRTRRQAATSFDWWLLRDRRQKPDDRQPPVIRFSALAIDRPRRPGIGLPSDLRTSSGRSTGTSRRRLLPRGRTLRQRRAVLGNAKADHRQRLLIEVAAPPGARQKAGPSVRSLATAFLDVSVMPSICPDSGLDAIGVEGDQLCTSE